MKKVQKRSIEDAATHFQPKRVESNIEFLERIMAYAATGPMLQLVVIHAARSYAEEIVALSKDPKEWEDFRKKMGGDLAMISPEGWLESCREIMQKFAMRDTSPRLVSESRCEFCGESHVE